MSCHTHISIFPQGQLLFSGLNQCLKIKFAHLGGSFSLQNDEAHADVIPGSHLQQVLSPGWRQEGGGGTLLWAPVCAMRCRRNSSAFLSEGFGRKAGWMWGHWASLMEHRIRTIRMNWFAFDLLECKYPHYWGL